MRLRIRRHRAAAAALALLAGTALAPGRAAAASFCDELNVFIKAMPDFAALRGAAQGADFISTRTIAAAPQCIITHPQGAAGTVGARWTMQCVWHNLEPSGVAWFKQQILACYPGSERNFNDRVAGMPPNTTNFEWLGAGLTLWFSYHNQARLGLLVVSGEKP